MGSAAVILPTLNEEKAIREVITEIPEKASGLEIEVFVIDGGSEDNTCEIVKQSKAGLIEQSYPGGKGSAMREAFDKINADIYVFMDADRTYSPEDLDKIIQPIIDGEAEHVTGCRLEDREDGAFMYRNFLGNKMYAWLFRRLTSSDVEDFLTGYRALSADLVEELELESKGFEIETELTFKTFDLGKEIKEVDITYRPRVGQSKLDFKSDGVQIMMYALKLSLS